MYSTFLILVNKSVVCETVTIFAEETASFSVPLTTNKMAVFTSNVGASICTRLQCVSGVGATGHCGMYTFLMSVVCVTVTIFAEETVSFSDPLTTNKLTVFTSNVGASATGHGHCGMYTFLILVDKSVVCVTVTIFAEETASFSIPLTTNKLAVFTSNVGASICTRF
jgi:hypothetical protein